MTFNHIDLKRKVVLGFDLGHGDTALTIIESCEDKEEQAVEVYSDITAIASHRHGYTIIGSHACEDELIDEYESFEIGFKSKPGINKQSDKQISDYSKAVYQKALEKVPQLENNTENIEFFIGCPTGWRNGNDNSILEAYKQLFINSGIPNPKIVAESDAAFAYYFDVVKSKDERDTEEIVLGELNRPIIVLDFGSSTLDITIGKVLGNPISFGIPLGASLIDKAILEWTLEHCLDDKFPLRKHINEDMVVEVREEVKSNNISYSKAEFKCRRIKEQYFNNPHTRKVGAIYLNEGEYELKICLKQDIINEILSTPLKDIIPEFFRKNNDPEIAEIARYSWLSRCEKLLSEDIEDKLLENNLCRDQIGVVILTGGASRMESVRELVKRYFPQSKNLSFRFDTNPSLSISKGLSCYGRIDIQTRYFEAEVDNFIKEKLGDIIGRSYSSTKLVEIIGYKIAEITEDKFKEWLEQNISSERIGYHIKQEMLRWSSSRELKNQIEKELKRLEKEISNEANKSLQLICERYGIGNVNLLPASFMRNDYNQILKEFCDEYNVDSSDISEDSFSFASMMQQLAQSFAGIVEDNLESDQFKNKGNGWGWWRKFNTSDAEIKLYGAYLGKLGTEFVSNCLADEKIIQIPCYAAYMSLQTVLRRKVNQAKYLIYSF